MQLEHGGKQYLTRTIWIYVAMFGVQAVIYRHHESFMFWTCCAALTVLFPPAIYFTTRRMLCR